MINIVSNSKFKNVTFSGFLYLGFLLVLLMSYYLILYKNPYTIDYSIGNLFYLPHILIASCTILFHGLNFLFYQIKYKITTIDLGVYSWIMTVLISRLHVIHDEPFFNDVTSNLLIASCFYFIIRQIANEILLKFWSLLLLPGLFVQIYFVATKYLNNVEDNLSYVMLTGTLGNSGICSAFIVINSPIALHLLRKKLFAKYLFIILLCILIFILRSRASFFAFIPIVFFYTKIDIKPTIKRIGNWNLRAIMLIFAISAIIFVFRYKNKSTMGRAFIWNLSIKNAFVSPFFGVGYGEFPEKYKKWQITYFQFEEANLFEVQLVDLPATAFNEPLQMFIEQGFIGLSAFIFIIIAVYSVCKIHREEYMPLKLGLLAGLIFSLFSYPYHSLPILVVLFMFLALIKGDVVFEFKNKFEVKFVLTLLTFSMCFVPYFYVKKTVSIFDLTINVAASKSLLEKYESSLPQLMTNRRFLLDYAILLNQKKEFEKCIEILTKAEKQSQSAEINLLMGDAFQSLGKYNSAKKQFLISIFALPNKLTPKYRLFNLYIKQKDTISAVNIGKYIVEYPVKITSINSMRLKSATKQALKKLEK